MSRTIVVNKIGRSPRIFEDDHTSLTMGDWEIFNLMRILSEKHPNDKIYYVGRARWNDERAAKAFPNGNVGYIKFVSNKVEHQPDFNADYFSTVLELKHVDEFHYILGPHSHVNGAIPLKKPGTDEYYKMMMVFMNYVAPIVNLMNANPDALHFPYISDRRYAFKARDWPSHPNYILSQCVEPIKYKTKRVKSQTDHTLVPFDVTMVPFRFDTIQLYGHSFESIPANIAECYNEPLKLMVSANQVTGAKFLQASRYGVIKEFVTDQFSPDEASICGKWVSPQAIQDFGPYFCGDENGLGGDEYHREIMKHKVSAIFFNHLDAPKAVYDNWLTPKFWEAMFYGSIALVESPKRTMAKIIPDELLFSSPKELREKFDRIKNDPAYRKQLYGLQLSILKQDYFDGEYFFKTMEGMRRKYGK